MDTALTASLEDYLEAIYQIVADKKAARAKDISTWLKVSGSSVTGALRALARRGLINYAPYDIITLTAAGTDAAKEVVRRHEALRDFMVKVLAIDEARADQAACQMEHSVPTEVLERLLQYVEFVDHCPRGGYKWVADIGFHCGRDDTTGMCDRCIALHPGGADNAGKEGMAG